MKKEKPQASPFCLQIDLGKDFFQLVGAVLKFFNFIISEFIKDFAANAIAVNQTKGG